MGLGSVVVAGHQTAGRGQQGNQWIDTGEAGLAISVVLPATTQPERSRAVASGIVVALGMSCLVGYASKRRMMFF